MDASRPEVFPHLSQAEEGCCDHLCLHALFWKLRWYTLVVIARSLVLALSEDLPSTVATIMVMFVVLRATVLVAAVVVD